MRDQAHELRRLVEQSRAAAPRDPLQPAWVLMAGGRAGVGTSTMALGLAAAVARGGRRTVLVEADPEGGSPASLGREDNTGTLADVLAGRRTVADVLQPGPDGLAIVPGAWGLNWLVDSLTPQAEDWSVQFGQLDPPAQAVVCDAGCGPNPIVERLWPSADHLVVVPAPDPAAVMNAYGLLKRLRDSGRPGMVHSLVNRAADSLAAQEAHVRLATAARRFLGLEVHAAGWLPEDPQLGASGDSSSGAGEAAGPIDLGTRRVPPDEAFGPLADRLIHALPDLPPNDLCVTAASTRLAP